MSGQAPDPSAPILAALNDFLGDNPQLASLLRPARSPRFRYFRWPKSKSGGRWDRWFAWTVQRARGPGGSEGFFALEYVDRGSELRLVRSVRFARRRMAKARARHWLETARKAVPPPQGESQ